MQNSKLIYHLIFFSCLTSISFSCKSDEGKISVISDEITTKAILPDKPDVSSIDTPSMVEKEQQPDTFPLRKEERIKKDNTKQTSIQISSKIEQVGGGTVVTDDKKYENAIKNFPKGSKISVIELGKQPEKKDEVFFKEIATKNTPSTNQTTAISVDINLHEAFDNLLKLHVSSSGKVNYQGLKSNVLTLDGYLNTLSSNVPSDNWTRNEKMAYWINTYNAFTIKKVLENYPLKSIKDLNGGKVWDQKFIKLGARTYSLNEIEHEVLISTYKDSRIHFALNCAAKSCPPLSNKAFTPDNLLQMLDRNAKDFINDPLYNIITKNKASISKVFDWYKQDFNEITDYLNKYSSAKIDKSAQISYNEYDWRLNE